MGPELEGVVLLVKVCESVGGSADCGNNCCKTWLWMTEVQNGGLMALYLETRLCVWIFSARSTAVPDQGESESKRRIPRLRARDKVSICHSKYPTPTYAYLKHSKESH